MINTCGESDPETGQDDRARSAARRPLRLEALDTSELEVGREQRNCVGCEVRDYDQPDVGNDQVENGYEGAKVRRTDERGDAPDSGVRRAEKRC